MNAYLVNLVDTNFNIIDIEVDEKVAHLNKDDFFIYANNKKSNENGELWIYHVLNKVFIKNDETKTDNLYLVLKPFVGNLDDIINNFSNI